MIRAGNARTEPPDPVHVRGRLRLTGERRHEETEGEGDEEAEGAARHGGVLQTTQRDRQPEKVFGASVGGWAARVNRHIRGFMWAATTRSASVRTDVKDVLTRAAPWLPHPATRSPCPLATTLAYKRSSLLEAIPALTVDHQHRLKSRPEIWKSGCCGILPIGDTTMGLPPVVKPRLEPGPSTDSRKLPVGPTHSQPC